MVAKVRQEPVFAAIDDDLAVETKPKRGAKRKAEETGDGSPKAAPKKKGARVANKVCPVKGCEGKCVNGKPACGGHVPNWDSLRHQAKTAKEGGDEDMWTPWLNLNLPENTVALGHELEEHALNNPPSSRYKRKSLINKVDFKRKHLKRRVNAAVTQTWPFTERKWMRYAVD